MAFDENGVYTGDASSNLNANIERINKAGFGGVLVWKNEGQGFLAQLYDKEHRPVSGGTTWSYHDTAPLAIERAAIMAEDNPAK